jgi:acyl-CoA reductase-like NAD-dependent aldehyde dehydrogenase
MLNRRLDGSTGAMYNSGQSCCSVERIYVHSSVYDEFVQEFANVASAYKLGNPQDKNTNLGPVISLASAERIRKQVKAAIDAGAKNLVDETKFEAAKEGTTYVAPVVLVNVNHEMEVMMEEVSGCEMALSLNFVE